MGRRHGPGGAPHAVDALIGLIALGLAAAPAPAQDVGEPPHWRQFVQWRDALIADAPAALAAWGEKADARLAWLHGYVTATRSEAEFSRWLAPQAASLLQRLHALLCARATSDLVRTLAEVMHLVEQRKDSGSFDAASEILAGVLAWVGTDRPEHCEFQLQLAECQRRAYRWDLAAQTLAAAEIVATTAGAVVPLHVQRAALLLARGMPDLAVADIDAAERASTDPWQAAQALFVRLRLDHALQRPGQAMARMREFLAAKVPPAVAADARWPARLHQLRIRAALAALADPASRSPDADEAVAWLHLAIDDSATSADERILARTVLITHLLDRERLDGVEAQLTAASREIAGGTVASLDERRLAVATLSLRHARLAGITGAVLDARAAELIRLWRLLVERWHEQPISRVGEGPLFFGDCRRAFVEMLRWRLHTGEPDSATVAALDEVVRASATGSLARHLGAAAPNAAAVQALCPVDGGILLFVPGHEASLAFAIDGATMTAHVLPAGAEAIDVARRSLLRALEAARDGESPHALTATARHCAEQLLPVAVAARVAGWRRLAIAGRESLGYVPFELLPGGFGERLGESHAVSYLPSLPVAVWLATNRPTSPLQRPPHLRLVACPDAPLPADAPERPTPLPFDDSDLAAIRKACAGAAVELVHGRAADRVAAFDGGAAVDFVQVLAHGIRDESRSDPQGILFGDGTITWPADIEALACPSHVFLNVCRAGRGRLRRGDDGRHLVSGALLIAGARAVVLPVLDVGYRSTLAFGADLHRSLWQQRTDLGEALRRARVAAAARGDRDMLDAFLFHLVGIGDQPLLSPEASLPAATPSPSGPWPVIAATTAAALAAALGRRRWRRSRSIGQDEGT